MAEPVGQRQVDARIPQARVALVCMCAGALGISRPADRWTGTLKHVRVRLRLRGCGVASERALACVRVQVSRSRIRQSNRMGLHIDSRLFAAWPMSNQNVDEGREQSALRLWKQYISTPDRALLNPPKRTGNRLRGHTIKGKRTK